MDISRTSIKEQLEEYGNVLYPNKGFSMEPIIKEGRDAVMIKKREKGCKLNKYDVVLFERPNGSLVLHRVTDEVEGGYLILGDNCIEKEFVPDERILGIMTGIVRNSGEEISVDDERYKKYSRRRLATYPIRRIYMRAIDKIRHAVKK